MPTTQTKPTPSNRLQTLLKWAAEDLSDPVIDRNCSMTGATIKWLAAAAIALILSSGHLLGGPTELDAIEDVADEVAALSGQVRP